MVSCFSYSPLPVGMHKAAPPVESCQLEGHMARSVLTVHVSPGVGETQAPGRFRDACSGLVLVYASRLVLDAAAPLG